MATTPTTTTEFHVRSLTRMLTEILKLPKTIAADIANMPRATFTRLHIGNPGNQDISGLEIAVIETLFATSSGMAVQAQLAERDLRLAKGGASVRARDTVNAGLALGLQDDLDILALGSLQVQSLIYEAKAGKEAKAGSREQYLTRLLTGHRIAQTLTGDALRAFALEETGDDASRIVALRLLANALFVAWELDEIEGTTDGSGARVQATLAELSDRALYRGTNAIAQKLLDPRLAYQIADVAALAGDDYAAAQLLGRAIDITGQDFRAPRAWDAPWLHTHPTEERHYDRVLEILESPLFKLV